MLKVGFNRHFHRREYAKYRFLVALIAALFPAIAAIAQPTINSTEVNSGTYGAPYTYSVTTAAWPNPTNLRITLVTGAPGINIVDNNNGTATLSGTPASAGTFPISIQVRDITDEQTSIQDFNLDVAKAVLTVTADPKSKAYAAALPPLTFVYSGFKGSDNASMIDMAPAISTTATAASHVASYPITFTGGSDNNYSFNFVGNNLTITKVALTIAANTVLRSYGSPNPVFTAVYLGFVNGDNANTPGIFLTPLQITTTALITSGVGNYDIKPSGATFTDYTVSFVAGTLGITKAVLTVRADNQTRTYAASNPSFTITYTGFVNGEGVGNITPCSAASPLGDVNANVGTYDINPSGGASFNYSFTYVKGTLTVTKATLTATAVDASRNYGAAEPLFTATYTGFLNGQNASVITQAPTGTTDALPTSTIGTYNIFLNGGTAQNYTFAYVAGHLTITKAPLTAKADNKTKTYGANNPQFTISYIGLKNSEDGSVIADPPTISTVATASSDAGSYTIDISGGTDENYTITCTTGSLTIDKAVLIVTAHDETRLYGAVNPPLSFNYSGFVGDDVPGDIASAPSVGTTAVATTAVGNVPINVSGGSDENYTFNYVPGNLSITKATLTATPNPQTRTYGAANPVFSIVYTGFVNSETATVIDTKATGSTAAGLTADVGTYDIDADGAIDNNYDFVYNKGTLTITKATLTVTANNQTKTYGADNPTLTITYSGFQNGDTPLSLDAPAPATSTIATAASPVNTYTIDLSNGVDNNYTYTLVTGTLNVTKATLTITAENKTKVYNTANPPFTIIYSGFMNGDDPGDISSPDASTVATLTSPVASYGIDLTGGSASNYVFALVTGTLTITKATPIITWTNPSAIVYGTPLGATQLNASANVPGTFDYTPAGGTILNAGVNPLTAIFTPSDLINYNVVPGITASITVNKATPIVTWANPAAITYGTTLNTTNQLNATANVPGSFNYTPGVGTLLNAGANQVLKTDFHPTDAANYNDVLNVQRQITVNKATPVVTWNNPAPITYLTPLSATQLNATFSVAGTPTYLPGAGTILPAGNQPISVSFTPTDQANYNSVSGVQVLVTVLKATPVITWPSPADITYGTALGAAQLNASVGGAIPGAFTYNPASGTVLSAGSGQILSVSFTPTDGANFNSVTNVTTTINVNKANPVITWAAPSPITYGTALSSTQLNASSSVPGAFMYNPASGTVLNAGVNQTISSTFTPTDQANYNTIITNRTITVNKATPVITWPSPALITYGTPLGPTQQNASANVPGNFIYTPAPGTIMTTGANQNISVRFEPTDATNFNVVPTTTTQITVVKATPVITWATPLPIKVGVALTSTQLNATADVPGGFTYTPNFGTSFAVQGTYTLHVAFSPSDQTNYNNIPDTQVQIVVSSKDNPVITWNDPAAITYGTPLSIAHLNASASVSGTYNYSPAAGTKLNAGTNQNLTLTFIPDDGVNYNSVITTVHINVNKAALTATAANASRAYGNANPTFNINYTGFVGTDNASVIDTAPGITCDAIAADPAGSTFPIKPAGGSDNNYQFSYVNGTLTIDKAPLIATADNKTRAYGLGNPPFTISYSGFANGDDAGDITQPSASTTATAATNVGGYSIDLNGGSASNYNITLTSGTLTITQALLGVEGDQLTRLYGDNNPPLTFRYLGFRNGDTEATAITTPPNVTTDATPASGVGVYGVTISGGVSTNYSLVPFGGSLTVTKAPLTIKAVNKSRPYGSANPPNTLSYTGFKNSDNPTFITQPSITGPVATATSDFGIYPIQLSGGSAANYDLILQDGSLTVTKATLTITAENKSKVYGTDNPALTIIYSGFLNGDDAGDITPPSISTDATRASGVATYPITLADGGATNYSFAFLAGTLTITPAALEAKAADLTRTYGAPNPTLSIVYTGWLNNDNTDDITPPTASTLAVETSNIGTYDITLSGGSAPNYTLTLKPGILSISKATITIIADDKTKVYGAANPPLTVTYSGLANNETPAVIDTPPTVTTTATTSTGVSALPVPIQVSGAVDNNYNFAYTTGSLTITKAPLTAKADNKSRKYGAADQPFTITYTGFVNGDNASNITAPIPSTVATATSNVGTYPIKLTGTTTNYAFTFQDGTLTINKADATIAADNKTRIYGAANPALTVTYSGLANNETGAVIDTPPTVTTTATTSTGVSTVPIQVSGAVDNNYNFTYSAGSLTITKAPLIAKADDKSRPYGSANPAATITYTGFMNNQGPSAITQPTANISATVNSPVGSYPITISGGLATNYQITLQPGTLTVAPAIITVTADNKTRKYGANNPALTVAYTGFVSGQSEADIDVLPAATTTATVTSSVGTYAITPSGGADTNYGFAYVNGALDISKATLTATADAKTTTYGTLPPLTITYAGFLNGDGPAVLDSPPVISTTATTTSPVNIYPISLDGGTDNNYNLVIVAGTIAVNKAPLIVKADDKTKVNGLVNPELTITYSGFVNGEAIGDIDALPAASTVATTSSPAGTYPIIVTGGNDDHYAFDYQPGTLTVLLDAAPVAKNFQVETDEDERFTFSLALFAANYTDDLSGRITYIKITSLPLNGALFSGNTRIAAGAEIAITNSQLGDLYYIPNSNFAGNDPFGWNLFDGSFLSANNATVTIKVRPVNDPPVLSNIETGSLEYSPGDQAIHLTEQLIINDVDDNFIFSASIQVQDNFTDGDELSVQGGVTGTKIEASYDPTGGELKLTGKETRAIYETILKKVTFFSAVTGEATVSEKNITLVVRDSIADSNIASRKIAITQVYPELDIVNAFTPNGDDVNDFWDIVNLDSYSEVMITVFNKEGTRVFSCDTNDCKWDGRANGELQPAGPYSYIIDVNNGKRRYRGTVNVLR